MKIIIEAEPKEIAALVLAVQERQEPLIWGELNQSGLTWGELNQSGLTWGGLQKQENSPHTGDATQEEFDANGRVSRTLQEPL